MDERDVLVGGWSGDQGGCLSDLGGVSILVLRVYYDMYYSRLIHYMYYERIRVYYRYRHVIHCISMYYGVLDLGILIPYNTIHHDTVMGNIHPDTWGKWPRFPHPHTQTTIASRMRTCFVGAWCEVQTPLPRPVCQL